MWHAWRRKEMYTNIWVKRERKTTLGRPMPRGEDNIKSIVKNQGGGPWIGLVWFLKGASGGLF